MQENDKLNPEELQSPKLATLPTLPEVEENISTTISKELEVEEKIMEGVEEVVDATEEDLNVKNYLKVSPTFYVKAVEFEEDEEVNEELYQVLNPETGVVEKRELTDDEKKELFIQQLKQSRKVFNPLSHPTKVVGTTSTDHPFLKNKNGDPIQVYVKDREVQTNVINNKYGTAYKQKRKRKNNMKKTSRKANR